jgi:hypothetical protein
MEFGWGLLPVAMDVADRVVVNEGSLADFNGEIELLAADTKWPPAAEPSKEAQLRYSRLATPNSEHTRPADRAYMELMRVRWHERLSGASQSGL